MIKISNTEYFSNDGTIRFLNMDCNEFMKGLEENEFDLNLSDPPYGIGYDESTQARRKRPMDGSEGGGRIMNKYKSGNKKWDSFTPTIDLIELIKKNIIKSNTLGI